MEARIFAGNDQIHCTTRNLGFSGMALKSSPRVSPGSFLRVVFSVAKGSEPIDVDAVLVRKDSGPQATCGIQFIDLSPRVASQISDYVRKGVPEAREAEAPEAEASEAKPVPPDENEPVSASEAKKKRRSRRRAKLRRHEPVNNELSELYKKALESLE
jgi:hypothetical protein